MKTKPPQQEPEEPECPDSLTGKHEYTTDDEYDQKKHQPYGTTIVCEYCGEEPPAKELKLLRKQFKEGGFPP